MRSIAACVFLALAAGSLHAESTTFELENGMRVALYPIHGRQNVSVTLLIDLGAHHDPYTPRVLNRAFWTTKTNTQPKRSWKSVSRSYPYGTYSKCHESFQSFTFVIPHKQLVGELKQVASRLESLAFDSQGIQGHRAVLHRHDGIERLKTFGKEARRKRLASTVIRFSTRSSSGGWSFLNWLNQRAKPTNTVLVLAGEIGSLGKEQISQIFGEISPGIPVAPASYTHKLPTSSEDYKPKTRYPKLSTLSELTTRSRQSAILSMAYCFPMPDDQRFASGLVAVSRLKIDLRRLSEHAKVVYRPLTLPGAMVIEFPLSKDVTDEKKLDKARAKIRKLVFESIGKPPTRSDLKRAEQEFALSLGTSALPKNAKLEHIGFVKARQLQLDIDGESLAESISAVSLKELYTLSQMFKKERAAHYISPRVVSHERMQKALDRFKAK